MKEVRSGSFHDLFIRSCTAWILLLSKHIAVLTDDLLVNSPKLPRELKVKCETTNSPQRNLDLYCGGKCREIFFYVKRPNFVQLRTLYEKELEFNLRLKPWLLCEQEMLARKQWILSRCFVLTFPKRPFGDKRQCVDLVQKRKNRWCALESLNRI